VTSGVIAPVTGPNNIDVKRAEIKQGVREVILCKDAKGKVGLRVRHVNKGVFVSYVHGNSPAALGGLRFGDQILQIDGETVAGYEMDKVMKIIKKASPQRIVLAVRDRWVFHLLARKALSLKKVFLNKESYKVEQK
jgi:syntenin-1